VGYEFVIRCPHDGSMMRIEVSESFITFVVDYGDRVSRVADIRNTTFIEMLEGGFESAIGKVLIRMDTGESIFSRFFMNVDNDRIMFQYYELPAGSEFSMYMLEGNEFNIFMELFEI